VAALTTMLDVTSLILTGIEGVHSGQAKLTFAMARHAAVDLAQVVNAKYDPGAEDRLPAAEFDGLRDALVVAGLRLKSDEARREKLAKLRSMYEPYVHSTAQNLMLKLPAWRLAEKTRDNWQAGPWDQLIQARGLGSLGRTSIGEDHF
jgi:hypothetical protein